MIIQNNVKEMLVIFSFYNHLSQIAATILALYFADPVSWNGSWLHLEICIIAGHLYLMMSIHWKAFCIIGLLCLCVCVCVGWGWGGGVCVCVCVCGGGGGGGGGGGVSTGHQRIPHKGSVMRNLVFSLGGIKHNSAHKQSSCSRFETPWCSCDVAAVYYW